MPCTATYNNVLKRSSAMFHKQIARLSPQQHRQFCLQVFQALHWLYQTRAGYFLRRFLSSKYDVGYVPSDRRQTFLSVLELRIPEFLERAARLSMHEAHLKKAF